MNPSKSNNKITNDDLLSRWSNIDHWRKLCPYLTISDNDDVKTLTDVDGGDRNADTREENATKEKLLERLIDDGYALLNNGICSNDDDGPREKVVRGISEMEVQHSLPATFILLFDETWKLAAESHRLLLRHNNNSNQNENERGILSAKNMAFNFDMLAWYIDPRLDQAGFSPHRDRQPDSVSALKKSFYDDGQAKYITHWIALADANPENSCLYVIPKGSDPGYLKGDDPPEEEEEEDGNKSKHDDDEKQQFSDPLSRALNTKQSYQNIRALPRQPGQSVIFTHRILHWGSRGNKHALDVRPRIAISFVYSDVEFEAPYLSEESLSSVESDDCDSGKTKWNCPSFSIRLLLVCAQLLIYYQRFNLSTATLRACYDYCKMHSEKLHVAYRKKVFVEYVKAMKESRDGIPGDDNGGRVDKEGDTNNDDNCNDNKKHDDDDDDDAAANSEDEEALLEEMLNHSEEFEDDYDDMCDDIGEQTGRSKKRKIGK